MATQNPDFPPIHFSITQPLTNIRLLEVPEEVLDIIASGQTLKFKSASSTAATAAAPQPKSSGSDENSREGFLHLCSNEKAWAVKQVSTSNSVYVTRPTNPVPLTPSGNAQSDIDADMDGDAMEIETMAGAITAFAKPTSILELYPMPAHGYEATVTEHLRNLVPLYDDSDAGTVATSSVSIGDIYDNIPAPDSVIKTVLARRGAFDLNGGCYVPSDAVLLASWKKIVEACTMAGAPVTGNLDIAHLLNDEDQATIAIAQTLLVDKGMFDALGLRNQSTDDKPLKEIDVTRWAGNLLLAQDKAYSFPTDEFVSKWEDLVPAAWIKYCSLDVLGDACEATKSPDGREVARWKPFTSSENISGAINGSLGSNPKPVTGAASSGKRKWHEKFAAQRNAKK